MRKIILAMAAASGLWLGAPALAQQASSGTIAASIPVGATEQDVESHYGPPTEQTLSEQGNEIWTYDIDEVQVEHKDSLLYELGFSSGNESEDKTVRKFRVWFDANGHVTEARPLRPDEME